MIYKIQKGGNYGWSVMEGTHEFRPDRKKGPSPILKPIVEHTHSDYRSMTGGFVYRGSKNKDLVGAYIYGDFSTGRIWAAKYDGKKILWDKELADTTLQILHFCEDQNGELLIGRRFDRRMDPTRPPRKLAVRWAEQERIAIEADRG